MHEADRLLMINQINLNLETAFPRFVSQESLSFILLLKSKALHRKVSKYMHCTMPRRIHVHVRVNTHCLNILWLNGI